MGQAVEFAAGAWSGRQPPRSTAFTTELAIFQKAVSPVDSERKWLYPFLDNLPASWLIQERKGYSHEKDSNKKAQVRQ